MDTEILSHRTLATTSHHTARRMVVVTTLCCTVTVAQAIQALIRILFPAAAGLVSNHAFQDEVIPITHDHLCYVAGSYSSWSASEVEVYYRIN